MSRLYDCPTCGKSALTESLRGPTPKRCDQCPPKPPRSVRVPKERAEQKLRALRSVPGIPDQMRVRQETTMEQVIYQDKMQLALAMRVDYAEWDEIAAACGYQSEQAAYVAVKNATAIRQLSLDESLDHIRLRELYRLDRLSAKAMRVLEAEHPLVQAGRVVVRELENGTLQELADAGPTLAAIDRLLKLSESRRKLLGLDAAQKVENAVTVQYTVEGIAESEMP